MREMEKKGVGKGWNKVPDQIKLSITQFFPSHIFDILQVSFLLLIKKHSGDDFEVKENLQLIQLLGSFLPNPSQARFPLYQHFRFTIVVIREKDKEEKGDEQGIYQKPNERFPVFKQMQMQNANAI